LSFDSSMQDTHNDQTLLELCKKQEVICNTILNEIYLVEAEKIETRTYRARLLLIDVYLLAKEESKEEFFKNNNYKRIRCDKMLSIDNATIVSYNCAIIAFKFDSAICFSFYDFVEMLMKTAIQEKKDTDSTLDQFILRSNLLMFEKKILAWKGLFRCCSRSEGRVAWVREEVAKVPEPGNAKEAELGKPLEPN